VRLRADGVNALNGYLAATSAVHPSAADLPSWQALLRSLLAESRVGEVLAPAVAGVVAGGDRTALELLKTVALENTNGPDEIQAVCAAYQLTRTDPEAWQAWVASLGSPASLPGVVLAHTENPGSCGGGADGHE
jgi:hypothetical protein